ncbi:aminomethyl-transferring glycine dehydrogenase subunit GcvPB [Geobacter sp. SVR]|uniref:aminomethyl-transferring glycine dehydrogenase subunit GcvPB n=1 Tax=Geobacter sp. SVR TaxID=2495594 RepID=UPI00143EF8A0|nr:aminomethyl-transferring glycine dehydrogenase subunit GcvPB [Geobacter sp. SVR]BCS54606.1 glycine dehydrogenase (aminomethyl-transferring) [Geobacter sp. SVR]GCF86887.1 glycine dehydrogenase (aminomethyl-transferring) [Geobacter sp. SVR]
MQLIYEKSVPGRRGVKLPASDVPSAPVLPDSLLRKEPAGLAEVSELDLVRHFTNLSRRNFSVDTNFYPLGSCTMKYNAKVLENSAALFAPFHPMTALLPGGEACSQGTLGMLYDLGQMLADITGMDEVTTQPLAGAHGEMTGILLIAAYHAAKGNKAKKKYVVVPDSSHGTNPASAAIAGYEIITVPTAPYGDMDLELFKQAMSDEVAAVMMTCPNTLGLFNPHIKEISDIAHSYDALMYYDGANLNAIMGKVKPGDVGFDVVHVNLHKTFGTPHGGGGPGSGPVGVKKALIPFLPQPRIVMDDEGQLGLQTDNSDSIGRTANFFGNFGVMVKAYAYIIMLGREGLIQATEQAVLNANYIKERLKAYYDLPYDMTCMHECVFSASKQLKHDVHAIDIAKYLIDRGYHPPTVYFPMIVKEAIMIEPTETESKATLDLFIDVMIEAARVAESDPQALRDAPLTMPVSRLDETKAAREQNVCCQ